MKLLCAKHQIEIKSTLKEHSRKCTRSICAGCENLFDEEDLDLYIIDNLLTICNLDTKKKRGHVVEDYGHGPFYGGEYVEYNMRCEYKREWDEIGLSLCTYDRDCEHKE